MKKSVLILIGLSLCLIGKAQDSLSIYLEQANEAYKNENFAKSMHLYKHAFSINHKSFEAIMGLADSKHKLDLFAPAIKDYDLAEKLKPNAPLVYFNRGAAKIFVQEYKSALKDFDKAMELNPNLPKIHYYIGFANAELDRFREAINHYNICIDNNPDYAAAYYNRGAAKAELKNYGEGMKDFELALTKNPNLDNGKINLALTKLGLKKYREAAEDLSVIIEMKDSNLAKAYFYRAEAYYEMKMKDEACQDWLKASNLGYEQGTENVNNFCGSKLRKEKRDIEIVF